MVRVKNGKGYDSLIEDYSQGVIDKNVEVLSGVGSIYFNDRGVLCSAKTQHPLKLSDLEKISSWGAAVKLENH